MVDGGSTDGTQEVIRKYRHKIAAFKSEPDNGMYDAMNKGLRLASGDIVGLELCRMAAVPLRNLAGKTSLGQLAAILAHARLVLTNDTSAAHIGPEVGVPTVCILGGGHYGRFLPYDLLDARLAPRAVSHRMDCFGCNWRCIYGTEIGQPFPCVTKVSVEDVWDAVEDVLGRHGVSRSQITREDGR